VHGLEEDAPVVRELGAGKGAVCEKILRALPLWFGIEQAILDYIKDVESMPFFVVEEAGRAVAFLALHLHNKWTAEVHVMGVSPERHRRGIGGHLVRHAEAYARERGCEFLTVKTLSPARENAEYERTRKFYEALDFRPLEEFRTLWGEANPCLFLAKKL
jgi:ribosomal protein S18 acetylase RimI-like enzyme